MKNIKAKIKATLWTLVTIVAIVGFIFLIGYYPLIVVRVISLIFIGAFVASIWTLFYRSMNN